MSQGTTDQKVADQWNSNQQYDYAMTASPQPVYAELSNDASRQREAAELADDRPRHTPFLPPPNASPNVSKSPVEMDAAPRPGEGEGSVPRQ